MEEYIMTIDEGTTSARAVLFNKDSEIIAICAKEFAQYYPQPGWVEQDPKEIWLTTKEVINRVVLQAGIDPRQIKAAGITNQRKTQGSLYIMQSDGQTEERLHIVTN